MKSRGVMVLIWVASTEVISDPGKPLVRAALVLMILCGAWFAAKSGWLNGVWK